MKIEKNRRQNLIRPATLVGVLIIVAAAVIVPFYSISASSSTARVIGNARSAAVNAGRLGSSALVPAGIGPWSRTSFLAAPATGTIAIFAADCTTPKTTFTLGETVCAKVVGESATNRWVNWIDSSSNITHGGPGVTDITNNTSQDFLYAPPATGLWKAAIADSSDSAITSTQFTVDPPAPIATYAMPGCVVPKTDFDLGETVCAKASGVPNTLFPWHINWVDPAGFVRQADVASNDDSTQYTYTLPNAPTTVVNGQTVDNRGTWRANVVRSNGSVRSTARFVVHEPTNPQADVLVQKFQRDSADSIHVGENAAFIVVVVNAGPDSAAGVHLLDSVPAGGTLVSFNQDSGPTCAPASPGDCTIAAMTNGDRAEFTVIYTIGGSPGPSQTSASISSTTADPNTDNNSSTANFVVAPGSGGGGGTCELTCPSDVVAFANTTEGGERGAHVTFDAAVGTGTCGAITATPASGSFFPNGTTVVSVTSETGDGECHFTVTVEEESGNVSIICPSNKAGTADANCEASFNLGTPTTAGDNVTVTVSRSDGKPMYDCDVNNQNCVRKTTDLPFGVGVTTVTWIAYSHTTPGPYATPEAEEAARNGSDSCTQTVTVNDVTAPNIAATDQTVSADANCQAVIPDYSSTVSDNCACASSDTSEGCEDHSRFTVTQTPAPGTIVGPGAHAVHIEANDGSSNNGGAGNTSSKDITFTVNDTTAPVITCPANQTVNTEPGTCAAHVVTGTATATDNCDTTPTITGTRSDGRPLTDTYPGGTTTITWRATDDAGNFSECSQTITVEDHENPTIVCPAPIVQGTDDGVCSATVNPGQPTANDNCGTPTVTGTRSDGQPLNAPYPKGTTTITWTATDSSGNQASCTQTITVYDDEAPTFTFTGTQTMWPPNHKYKTFTLANLVASVQDNCDGPIPVSSVVITKVTSDEIENGNGDGNTMNDIVIAADCKSVQLRSEREGNGNGRVYTIFFSVRDAAGNVGTGSTKVVVPHNPGETAIDSGPHYTVMSNCP